MAQAVSGSAAPARSPGDLRRVIVASLIGTTIEWYDFFLYGTAAALVFNKLFFPKADPLTGAMLAFSTYALGFVARPIGGLVFGHFGDRIGRKRLLMLSLVMMGVSSSLIGLLPTYAQVGSAAPAAAHRPAPGAGLRGRRRVGWGGADGGRVRRRPPAWDLGGLAAGRRAGRQSAGGRRAGGDGGRAGQPGLPGLGLARAVPAVGGAGGVRLVGALAAWPRARCSKLRSPEPANRNRRPRWPPLKARPGGIAIGAGLRLGENVSYYIVTAVSITYATTVAHVSRGAALNALLVGAAAEVVAMPLFSALSDRIGRRWIYAIGAAGMGIWMFAFFKLLDQARNRAGDGGDHRRADPARGHVRAAGGVHLRTVSHPLPLFRRLDRLPADQSSSPAPWPRSSPSGCSS